MRSGTSQAIVIVGIAMLISGSLFYLAPHFAQAEDCSTLPGTRPATADDAVVKNGHLTVGTCYNPNDVGISQNAEEAKQYLLSIARNLRNSGAPPDKAHINPLNASFAICEAKFLKAYTDRYGPIYVVSAFRCGPISPAAMTCDRNENGLARGASASNHQLGLAVDVNPADGDYAKAHAFARANPQFGVWFRLGMDDKYHMEPTNKSNPSCDGVAGTPVTLAGNTTPSSGLSNYIRRALGGEPMNRMQCVISIEPLQIVPPGTVPESECLNNGQGPPQLPPPPPPPPQQQPQPQPQQQQPSPQSTQPGSSQPPVSSQISTNPPVSGSINPRSILSGSNATPTIDLIDQYANLVSGSIDIASIVPISLNDSLSSTTQLQDISNPIGNASGTVAINQNYIPQQTFTSGDLANNPVWGVVPQQNGFLARLLSTLKDILLYLLDYLKPFGGNVPTQASYIGNLE